MISVDVIDENFIHRHIAYTLSAFSETQCKLVMNSAYVTGRCFSARNDRRRYSDARRECRKLGGDLAKVRLLLLHYNYYIENEDYDGYYH